MIDLAGRFYRAVDPRFTDSALEGSRRAGRYSRADQPTLYLSSSREGVEAAMRAHGGLDGSRVVLALEVQATRVLDLRDEQSVRAAGLRAADAAAPWQEAADSGGEPSSWAFRDTVEGLGAHGLVDPSRQEPGLWHLVLFVWNVPGGPQVRPVGRGPDAR